MKGEMIKKLHVALATVIMCCFTLAACGPSRSAGDFEIGSLNDASLSDPDDLSPVGLSEGEKLRVVATTTIVGDVVSDVGGTAIELTTLLPVNADPHAYELTPSDLRAVSDAHVVFINGLGLEEFIEEMLKNVRQDVPFISLSEEIDPLTLGDEDQHDGDVPEGSQGGHANGGFDPHVWFDPTNVMIWTDRVSQTLSALDPENRPLYEARAGEYKEALADLDEWIFERVSRIPESDRKFVSDHRSFAYFAARYGFDVVGAVIPVYSSAAEPSAREIVELQQSVQELGVEALFVGVTVNPNVVRSVVEDTGIKMIPLYTGSLSDPQGPAGSYIDFMKYNVESIVNVLSE